MSTINCLGPDCGNHGSGRVGSTRCRVLRPTACGPVSFGSDKSFVAWTDVLLDAVSVARVGVAMAGVGTLRKTTAAAAEMVTAPRVARQIIVMVATLPAATRRGIRANPEQLPDLARWVTQGTVGKATWEIIEPTYRRTVRGLG